VRITVEVYRDGACVHCSVLGAKTFSVLATLAETPEFLDRVAGWLSATFDAAGYPLEGASCEAKIVRVEDEKLEYELVFRRPYVKRPEPQNKPTMAVARDEYGNIDFSVPPPKET
jgi:hypothetical protein